MTNSHVVEILKTFDTKEIEDFLDFMNYSNGLSRAEHVEARLLLNHILNFYPEFNSPNMSKEFIFKVLYPNKAFIEGRVDKVMVSLNKCLKRYLLISQYLEDQNEFQQTIDILNIYKKRSLNARYLQTYKTLEYLAKSNTYSLESMYQQFQFEYEKHDWLSLYNNQKEDLNLPNTIKSLIEYYQAMLVELANRYELQNKLIRLESSHELNIIISSSIDLINKTNSNSMLIFVTSRLNNILKNNNTNEKEIKELSDFLNSNSEKFDLKTLRSFYTYLRNICVILINNGDHLLKPSLLYLQKEHLKRGYILYNNMISPSAYISIVGAALDVNDLQWAYEFVEKYKNLIIGETEDNSYYKFGLARCLFSDKKFEDVLSILLVTLSEISLTLIARRLELKSYFELKSDLVSYKLDALKMYINRISHKSLPPAKKEIHLNFINLFSQIVQSIPGDKARSQKLIKRILAKKVVADRDWLLEKAREIGNLSDDEYAEAIKNPPTKE